MLRRFADLALLLLLPTAAVAAPPESAWKEPARYELEYEVDFSKIADPKPAKLRVWLPHPAETNDQKILDSSIDSPWPHRIHSDDSGNKIVYLEGEGVPSRPVTMRFTVERQPSDGIRTEEAKTAALDPRRYLRPNTLIPLEGVIRELAEQESRGRESDSDKVRAFYDYVVRNMRYNKDGTGWGRGDAIWACANKRGNCTDFHSLFIGMARSQQIPARFLIGLPIPGDSGEGTIPGYHCWAEYYDDGRGWLPVDASEANKSGKPDAYFGTLPNDRIEFTAGRDLTLAPPQAGPPLNFFIYPYAEGDGTPVPDLTASFRFRKLPLDAAPAL